MGGWDSRLIRKLTASAGTMTVTGLPERNSRLAEAVRSEFASKLLRAAEQLYRMSLTMDIITRHHLMVGEASVCRESAPIGRHNRNPLLRPPVRAVQSFVPEREYSVFARPVRSYRMSLTMDIIIRHHLMVGEASVCRKSARIRHRNRNPLLQASCRASLEWAPKLQVTADPL